MKTAIQKLVVASHNEGKVSEIRDLLRPFGVRTHSARELALPDIEETGLTFKANALLKAKAAAQASGMVALSDDSGLAVDALGGAPGIYSARWAELPDTGERNFGYAMARIYEEMKKTGAFENGNTGAHFICALALVFPDGSNYVYEGKVMGDIIWPGRGHKGFGYDPVFKAKGDALSFAELEPAQKHAKSHRADAFSQLTKAWFAS